MQIALQEACSATPDTSGGISFIFPPVDDGSVWTGSIVIDGVRSNSVNPIVWIAKDAGNIIGKWFNDLPSNSMQARSQVIVTGVNVAGTTQLRAVFYGIETKLETSPIVWPIPPPAPPPTSPFTLFSGVGPIAIALNTTLSLVTNAPVALGTSVEISAITNNGPGACRISIAWTFGTLPGSVTETLDLTSGASVRGWTLINKGPFISIVVIASPTAAVTLDSAGAGIVIITGMPPISIAPIQLNGNLISTFIAAAPVGDTIIAIPPYMGPAIASAFMNATTSNASLYMRIVSFDFQSTQWGTIWIQPQASADTGRLAGIDPNIEPTLVSLPSIINQLIVTNGSAGVAPLHISLVPVL